MISFQGKTPQFFHSTGEVGGGPVIKPSSKTLTETLQTRFAKGLDSDFKGLVNLFAQMCAEVKPGSGKGSQATELASLRRDLDDILWQAARKNSACRFFPSTKKGELAPLSVISTRGLAIEATILPSAAGTPLLRISAIIDAGKAASCDICLVEGEWSGTGNKISSRFTEAIENAALMLMNHEPVAASKKELDAKYAKRIDSLLASLQAIEGKEVSHDKFKPCFDELAAIIKEVSAENKNLQFEFKEGGSPSFSELSPNDGKYSLSISGKGDYGQYIEISLALIRDYKRTRLDNGFACMDESSNTLYPRMLSDDLFRRSIVEAAEDVLNFDGRTLDNLNK